MATFLPKVRTESPDPRPPGAPGAVWDAFARQAAWKNWTLIVLFGLLLLSLLANVRLAARPPEFVVVENPGGKSTYVRRAVATDALLKFLADKTKPPEIAVVRFTRDFVHLAFGINSSTIDANWPQALAMMTEPMRERIRKQTDAAKLLDTYRAAQVRSELAIEDILLIEQTPTLLHVKTTLSRRKGPLLGGGPFTTDRLAVDLVEAIVAVSPEHPDGLAVAEWQIQELAGEAPAGTNKETPHAP
jgi:hypothetical protein